MDDSGRPLGLILRIRPWRESDMLLDMFTDKYGRITALVKGGRRSRRRFSGQLLSAQLLGLEMTQGNDLWILRRAELLANYLGLRQDYRRWLASGPVLELLLRGGAPLQPLPGALYLALLTLKRLALSNSRQERQAALLIFLNRFLWEIGFGLYLRGCLLCRGPLDKIPASLSLQGGAVCTDCLPNIPPAPRGLISSLLAGQSLPLDALGRLGFTKAALPLGLLFISQFARASLGHDLPSLEFMQQL